MYKKFHFIDHNNNYIYIMILYIKPYNIIYKSIYQKYIFINIKSNKKIK